MGFAPMDLDRSEDLADLDPEEQQKRIKSEAPVGDLDLVGFKRFLMSYDPMIHHPTEVFLL